MRLMTPAEAAKRLRVSPITLRKWADAGLIQALVTVGGHRRYPANEVERMLERQKIHRSRELKVMIVDDDLMTVELLHDYLRESAQPVQVEIARDGFDAGRKLVSFQPDVILLDLMMPGLNGFDVCRRVKAAPISMTTRVIAMTSYPSEANVRRILDEGAEACLAKPVERETLMEMLWPQGEALGQLSAACLRVPDTP